MLAALSCSFAATTTTNVGKIVTITTTCTYQTGGTLKTADASANMVVVSALSKILTKPIYLTKGLYQYSKKANGSVTQYIDKLAIGMLVRILKRDDIGQLHIIDGYQLADGRVYANGTFVTRDE